MEGKKGRIIRIFLSGVLIFNNQYLVIPAVNNGMPDIFLDIVDFTSLHYLGIDSLHFLIAFTQEEDTFPAQQHKDLICLSVALKPLDLRWMDFVQIVQDSNMPCLIINQRRCNQIYRTPII